MYLGIDAGGTHTDAVLVEQGHVVAQAKVPTQHDNLPASVAAVLAALPCEPAALAAVSRVTVGTTLAVNAVVQGKLDPVGLVLSAGPGLAPERAALGQHVYVAGGGLDHRGQEVTRLDVQGACAAARAWVQQGVQACAVVGKFSPRNPEHEQQLAKAVHRAAPGLSLTQGHSLSGALNFPRRVATAYYNAAFTHLHTQFIDALEQALAAAGIHAPAYLLKADGGALPFALSRREPVQSALSGPAASVMGLLALCPELAQQDSLLLDIGGTTTDIALFTAGSPVLERDGMRLGGRATLVRSLATVSLGIGGDSLLHGAGGQVLVGPERRGRAVAFGGHEATLLDALNVVGLAEQGLTAGDAEASRHALDAVAQRTGWAEDALGCAKAARQAAVQAIAAAVHELVQHINAAPVYTLAALMEGAALRPAAVWLVGAPAALLRQPLAQGLGLPVHVPPHAACANAVGAALTQPTASLTLLADTGAGFMRVPTADITRPISRSYSVQQAEADAKAVLKASLATQGLPELPVEIVASDMFATLNDQGYGSKDIRVQAQLVPGLVCPHCV
ncbi:MAG: hydantoinase/oxoprolinase family protein [Desulfovibrionaceae bacterium]|nr:hydantoinase/oxoprolinase family protein [Desulfovibrionaceae bacterium]